MVSLIIWDDSESDVSQNLPESDGEFVLRSLRLDDCRSGGCDSLSLEGGKLMFLE